MGCVAKEHLFLVSLFIENVKMTNNVVWEKIAFFLYVCAASNKIQTKERDSFKISLISAIKKKVLNVVDVYAT